MNNHGKKMIAPIIITVTMIIYYIFYFGFFIILLDSMWKYILGIISIILSAVMIKVCIGRTNEIKKGEVQSLQKE